MSKDELENLGKRLDNEITLCEKDVSGDYDRGGKGTAKLAFLGYKDEMNQAVIHLRQAKMWIDECFKKSYN